ncbi:hypothetical protein H257_18325 [Aphanomyces astaci]|uniref:Uncharacterized protein n=1 Tax=Aphanomyces astaci TaxID=112090 RepID=W4FD72_APHAT|nr:hypothetical protein H257_18325 [Aphanomyces astaci]ETV64844.1 hypothetical protein H257_18325 [Aphanomyces astaci]|eukprot:XP_009845663.1 hypothetical protein H257_18325 [Aphanomyces astaci]
MERFLKQSIARSNPLGIRRLEYLTDEAHTTPGLPLDATLQISLTQQPNETYTNTESPRLQAVDQASFKDTGTKPGGQQRLTPVPTGPRKTLISLRPFLTRRLTYGLPVQGPPCAPRKQPRHRPQPLQLPLGFKSSKTGGQSGKDLPQPRAELDNVRGAREPGNNPWLRNWTPLGVTFVFTEA